MRSVFASLKVGQISALHFSYSTRGLSLTVLAFSFVTSPDNHGDNCAYNCAPYDGEIATVLTNKRCNVVKPRRHPTCSPTKWILAGRQIIRSIYQTKRDYPPHYCQKRNQDYCPSIFKLDKYLQIIVTLTLFS